MNANQMRLRDAGHREQAFAQRLLAKGHYPAGVTVEDLMAHGVYDAREDSLTLTVKSVPFTFKFFDAQED